MSATLEWNNSGLATKTGTASADLINDLVTLVTSKSGDADFKWEVADSENTTSPLYVNLKRKDASDGRLLFVIWTSGPAANNAAILDQAPTTNNLYAAYFPAGDADSASNLDAASGTIVGDDTNCTKVWPGMGVSTVYTTSNQICYFDTAEGIVLFFCNPASPTAYMGGVGALVVDDADVAYGCSFSYSTTSVTGFGSTNSPMLWNPTPPLAGAQNVCLRTNYGSANRRYYHAFTPAGAWASRAVDGDDILTDTGTGRAWFAPVQLMGNVEGEGPVLKLRQIAWGPGSLSAFPVYNSSTLTPAAIQLNGYNLGQTGAPWLTNIKI